MRKYIIKHSITGEEKIVEAINSEIQSYCHEFYIQGLNGELITAKYATRNWDIIEVLYPKEMIK